MLIFRSLLVLILAAMPVAAEQALRVSTPAQVTGPARVMDGDTVEIGGTRIRLFGLDAPERGQSCGGGAVRAWPCGAWARQVLEAALSGQRPTCLRVDTDAYGRMVALCTAGGRDIGAALVEAGAATAYLRYSDRYRAQEARAKAAGRGIWSGGMTAPEDHRRATAAGTPPAPGSCAIKGNVSANGRIYHRPGQRDYDAVRIDPRRGEGWFCSGREARAAGFRPARR